jgi:hypothetical protein
MGVYIRNLVYIGYGSWCFCVVGTEAYDDDDKPVWPNWAVGALFRDRDVLYEYG